MSMLDRHHWSKKFRSWLNDSGFEARTVRWERANGLAELLIFGQIGDAARPTVLFLHGLGNDALFPNINLFRYLLSSGYNIVTFDLDGHGTSATTKFSRTSAINLVEDIVLQCDAFIIGRPRLHLCGYSLGAVLMLDYAVHHPERTRSLALIGMPMKLRNSIHFAAEIITPLLKSYRSGLRDYGITGIHPAIGPLLRHRYPIRLSESETGNYLQIAAGIIDSLKPQSLLQTVSFPTLYIAGTLDFIAHYAATAQFLSGLNIQTVTLSGETHFSSMLCPKTANRIEVLLRTSP